MKIALLILSLLWSLDFYAQSNQPAKANEMVDSVKPTDAYDAKIFDVVEQMPSFKGGDTALMQWLSQNIKYPVEAEEKGVQGRVIAFFVVEGDGSISNVKIEKGVEPSIDNEAIRVLKTMPRWLPGKQDGKPVRVRYAVPITFKLQEEKKIGNDSLKVNEMVVPAVEEIKVFDAVEQMPSFKGGKIKREVFNPETGKTTTVEDFVPPGDEGLKIYLDKTVNYPIGAEDINGRVVCTFIVNTDGSISDSI